MAELRLLADDPFEHALPIGRSGAADGAPGVVVEWRSHTSLIALTVRRGQDDALAESLRRRYGLDLPNGPRRAVSGSTALVGIGPGRWLFIQETDDPSGLAATLAEALGAHAAIVDLSDSRAVLRLTGPLLRAVLAKGLPIDLHPDRLGPNDAATSVIALINVQLWQIEAPPGFEIAVPRSYVGSFAAWLTASAAEFGLETGAPLGKTGVR